jgi:membrane peptidoglycan carboxypeptidase
VIPGTTAINYNTDYAYGGSQGFQTGSAFKAFTLAAWLEAGYSLSETINASHHDFPMSQFHNSCASISGPDWYVANDEGSASRLSVLRATAQSVNTAFAMMATKLDLCSILNAAKALDVHAASPANPLTSVPSMILGTNYVSPLTMATAYAGIGNGGKVCTPVAIDRIVNADGSARPITPSKCTQGLTPEVANGVAYALQGVMRSGGTAASANPGDGIPILGKTGTTDNSLQNWLVTSTTKIATATWVGNVTGATRLRSLYFNGVSGGNVKFHIAKPVLQALNARYGGGRFGAPSSATIYGAQTRVPDVSGQSVASATAKLTGSGFTVASTTSTVDSADPAGTVAATSPAAGTEAAAGSSVTLQVSNGALKTVPGGLVGQSLGAVEAALRTAGFTTFAVAGPGKSNPQAKVTALSPSSGSTAHGGDTITISTG